MRPEERACLERLLNLAPPGPRIEFGVFRGGTLKLIARHKGITIGVDTFEGMPPPGPRDVKDGHCPYPAGRLAAPPADAASMAGPDVQLVKGVVPAALADLPQGPFAFAHVDLDHYEPTLAAMTWLWPRMKPGGIICADDWFSGRDWLAGGALNAFAAVHPFSGTAGRKAWWRMDDAATREISAGAVTAQLIAAGDIVAAQGAGFEPETLAAWAGLAAAGGTVLDVGAYTGLFAIVAAKLGCHVIAFEPMPKHAMRARANFALNGVSVDLRQQCAAARCGPATLKFNPQVRGLTSGASLIRPSGGSGRGAESQPLPVEAVTIDSLGLAEVTAIKIDVERAEPLVLAGAAETLRRCRPALIVEVLGAAEKEEVTAAVPGYRTAREMDGRNWLMLPC